MFSLRQMQVFLTTARTENVSKAAVALNMSQSAASGALKELEQHLRTPLFARVGKRLVLNEAGRALRINAEELMDRAKAIESTFLGNKFQAPLRIGATVTIGNHMVVPIIAQFHRTVANQPLDLLVANTTDIKEKLLRFELDMALIEGEVNHPDLKVENWLTDELVVFCGPNHPFTRKKSLSDRDLLASDWVLRETGSGTRQTFDRAFHDLLPNLSIKLTLGHSEAIKQAVLSDIGIGCLSRIVVEDEIARGDLVALPLQKRDLKRQLYSIQHIDKFENSHLKAWLDLVRDVRTSKQDN